jgi:sugar O-acyltransferase (sialic acid O-acetyltransferase NeuD family)
MKIIIYGNGSIARILYSFARRNMEVCGFTVDDVVIKENENSLCGLPLIPFSRVKESFDPAVYKMIIAVGFIEMNELRARKYQEAKEMGYSFTSYIDPSVFPHDDVIIEENCIILDHVSIHPGCRIGQGTFITSNVNIGHDCIIGDSTWINAGVAIGGGVRIGEGCFFGVNSSTGHGIQIGARNFIGANTLINKSSKDDEVYISEPGQLFRLKSKSFLKFSKVLG